MHTFELNTEEEICIPAGPFRMGCDNRYPNDPNTLREFVRFARDSFPANHYALILSSHGSSFEVAFDHSPTDEAFSIKEIGLALQGLPKLDVIHIAACLMGNVETAYELASAADFYVGIETIALAEIGIGAGTVAQSDYIQGFQVNGSQIKVGASTPPEALARMMAQSYATSMKAAYGTGAIAAVRLDKLPGVIDKVSYLARTLERHMQELGPVLATQVRPQVVTFKTTGSEGDATLDERFVDLYHLGHGIEQTIAMPDVQGAAGELKQAVDQYVISMDGWETPALRM